MLEERNWLLILRAADEMNARIESLDAMTNLAQVYIERGETQEGADVLAFVLRCPDTAPDTAERAQQAWDDLACYICPRVLLDAEDFASKATYADLLEYVFAGTS